MSFFGSDVAEELRNRLASKYGEHIGDAPLHTKKEDTLYLRGGNGHDDSEFTARWRSYSFMIMTGHVDTSAAQGSSSPQGMKDEGQEKDTSLDDPMGMVSSQGEPAVASTAAAASAGVETRGSHAWRCDSRMVVVSVAGQ